MEKECNEKIMAISEYSDTVVEDMNKTHNEIMFLYSMLNDKHTELTGFSAKLQELAVKLKQKDEEITGRLHHQASAAAKQEEASQEDAQPEAVRAEPEDEAFLEEEETTLDEANHNAAILALHKEGCSAIDIARELALGLGEVQLVIGLYEGKKKK